MSGATSLILDVCKGDRVRRRGAKREGVVAPRNNEKTTSGDPSRVAVLKGRRRSVGRWVHGRTSGREREDWVGSRHAGTETSHAQVGEKIVEVTTL